MLIQLQHRPEGTPIDEMMTATGWPAHAVRGAMAGTLKKKIGPEVTSETVGAVLRHRPST